MVKNRLPKLLIKLKINTNSHKFSANIDELHNCTICLINRIEEIKG